MPGAAGQPAGPSGASLRINTIIEALEQGRVAESGSNWTFVDMEHGPYLIDQLRSRFDEMAKKRKPNGQLETTPVVRLPMYGEESPSWAVKQVLDLGGLAIVFPQIETRGQAVRAIRSMRFPPQRGSKYPNPPGIRGLGGGSRALWGKISPDDYFRRADVWPLNPEGELFAVIMIETPRAIRNLNQILDVPGIGAVFIGPNDLSISLGVGPQRGQALEPETDAAVQTVLKGCKAKKVICGIAATWATKERRQELQAQGFRFML
jgi:4-hydroxy-2-oxoheptanedioate aldolase